MLQLCSASAAPLRHSKSQAPGSCGQVLVHRDLFTVLTCTPSAAASQHLMNQADQSLATSSVEASTFTCIWLQTAWSPWLVSAITLLMALPRSISAYVHSHPSSSLGRKAQDQDWSGDADMQADEGILARIQQRYGDHLHARGDYDGAMAQYMATMGQLEASYVIRKFLDAQRIHNLTAYLEQLHEKVQHLSTSMETAMRTAMVSITKQAGHAPV